MRLIDADRLKHKITGITKPHQFVEEIDKRPTVNAIPIDKPFLKMRYGDYVVYNKKWLVDHLQTEWNILQGKEYQPSIPVEWIDEYTTRLVIKRRFLVENGYQDIQDNRYSDYISGIMGMLDDWEKENERINN